MVTKNHSLQAVCVFPILSAIAASSVALAGGVEAIYTKIPDDPSSIIPGAVDEDGNPVETNFRRFHDLIGSPDGSHWLLRGRTQLGSNLENTVLLGSENTGTTLLQEGQPIPGGEPGEEVDFFGSALGRFNDHNDFAFSVRARGGDTNTRQKILRYTDGEPELVIQMGDPYTGLIDDPPGNSGNELVGNSIGSIHLLNDGTIGAHDSTIQNIHSSRRPALFYNLESFQQRNVDTFIDIDGQEQIWGNLSGNDFYSTPDFNPNSRDNAGHWMAIGRMPGGLFGQEDVLVYNGVTVLQEDAAIPDTNRIVDGIFNFELITNGDYYVRGRTDEDLPFAFRNGELFTIGGEPIVDGSDELWNDSFRAFTGNTSGDWVLIGTTTEEDEDLNEVMVVNGQVVVRAGDPVDVSGNGKFDDDAYIGRSNNTAALFQGDDVFIGDDGYIYFIAYLRDSEGNDLNSDPSFGPPDAFLRVPMPVDECPWDLTDTGTVDVVDLLELLGAWGPNPGHPADFNDDGVVDVLDLLELLANWGACP